MVLPSDSCGPVKDLPGVSILIPAFNEQDVIVQSVSNLVFGGYRGELEVCICDDGSTDNTLQYLINTFKLQQQHTGLGLHSIWSNKTLGVNVISQQNKGRAAALNSAFSLALMPYVVQTDADTIIDTRGLQKIIVAMENDKKLEAVGGTLLLANNIFHEFGKIKARIPSARNMIEGVQTVEYIRAFLYGRLGLNKLGGNVCVSGAFGVFRNLMVSKMYGWNESSIAEDMDMTVRIRMAGGKTLFIPEPVAWTQAPPDLKSLGHQRSRWHRGLSQIFGRYGSGRHALFKHGALGKFILPTFFVVEWLAPLFEAAGLILIAVHLSTHGLSWLAFPILVVGYLLNVLLSIISIKFEKDNFNRYVGNTKLFLLHAFLEPLWYRPLMIFWRLRGLVEHLTGRKGWGGMITRKSFGVLALLLLTVIPAKADTWFEGISSIEAGEVQGYTDVMLTSYYDEYTLSWLTRARDEQRTDQQLMLDYHHSINSICGFNTGANVSSRGQMLARNGIYVAPFFMAGHFVFTPAINIQNFKQDERLVFGSFNIDYYVNNYRLGVRQLFADKTAVKATTISLQHIGDMVNLTLYASDGNEVLNIPLALGANRVYGGIIRMHTTDVFEIILGGNFGERNKQDYITGTIGIRTNF
jgi:cellulose synthase/poly-beta-1,6-N-acetylglucosamine synthase-like glycosyltransferase